MSCRVDGAPRQAWYGEGEQPWDVIVRLGWGPAFAASNVIKYLRRTKGDQEHDLASARWYWGRLEAMGCELELDRLNSILAPEETILLTGSLREGG